MKSFKDYVIIDSLNAVQSRAAGGKGRRHKNAERMKEDAPYSININSVIIWPISMIFERDVQWSVNIVDMASNVSHLPPIQF